MKVSQDLQWNKVALMDQFQEGLSSELLDELAYTNCPPPMLQDLMHLCLHIEVQLQQQWLRQQMEGCQDVAGTSTRRAYVVGGCLTVPDLQRKTAAITKAFVCIAAVRVTCPANATKLVACFPCLILEHRGWRGGGISTGQNDSLGGGPPSLPIRLT